MGDAVIVDASVGPPYGTKVPDQTAPPAAIVASVTFSLVMSEAYCNLNGVMHGGAAGVIFDMFTTSALGPIARPGYWE
jgi:acyl-coenzyme A thioesterase 13